MWRNLEIWCWHIFVLKTQCRDGRGQDWLQPTLRCGGMGAGSFTHGTTEWARDPPSTVQASYTA